MLILAQKPKNLSLFESSTLPLPRDYHHTFPNLLFFAALRPDPMATAEDQDLRNGWPLGLEVMNTRLRMAESARLPATATATDPLVNSLHVPSFSFSSLSSSELDTMSTASFFQDHSVSLGRLIGIRPAEKTWLYFPTTDETETVQINSATKANAAEISGRICIPIVIGIILKMIRNRRNSRS